MMRYQKTTEQSTAARSWRLERLHCEALLAMVTTNQLRRPGLVGVTLPGT